MSLSLTRRSFRIAQEEEPEADFSTDPDVFYPGSIHSQETKYLLQREGDRNVLTKLDPTEAKGAELRFTALGTASGGPDHGRNASSYVLQLQSGEVLMFDCGEGTLRQLTSISGIRFGSINKIFITHLHGDHLFGLPGLVSRLFFVKKSAPPAGPTSSEHAANAASSAPIEIYGPVGIREYISTIFKVTSSSLTRFPNMIAIKELVPHEIYFSRLEKRKHPLNVMDEDILPNEDGSFTLYSNESGSVIAYPIQHTVSCYAYCYREPTKKGKINAKAIEESFGIEPGAIYRQIKHAPPNELFTAHGGTPFYPAQFVERDLQGRCVVVLGDTCNANALVDKVGRVDLMTHEATCLGKRSPRSIRCACAVFALHAALHAALRAVLAL